MCAPDYILDLSVPVLFVLSELIIWVQLYYIVYGFLKMYLNADMSGFSLVFMPASHLEVGSIYFMRINQIFSWDTRLFNFANDK